MATTSRGRRIPEATVARLPVYLRILLDQSESGIANVSSEELADLAGVNAAKVRKDLSYLGTYGTRGVGYEVEYLIYQVRRELGLTHDWPVVIVGAGNLGQALAGYGGFGQRGFPVAGIVDNDPAKVGTVIGGVARRAPSPSWRRSCAPNDVSIGVVATPGPAAQEAADLLVAAGVTSILNFAPVVLTVPAGGQRPQGRPRRRAADPELLRAAPSAAAAAAPLQAVSAGSGRDAERLGWRAPMSIVVIGVNHRTAPLAVLERLTIAPTDVAKAVVGLAARDNLREVAVLSTCNRTEVYAVAERFHGAYADIRDFLCELGSLRADELHPHLYSQHDDAAAQHLFEVAAGLDSAVLGESEILGQVRAAWQLAKDESGVRSTLDLLFRHALRVGKRARTETAIGRGTSSISHAAVEMVTDRLGALDRPPRRRRRRRRDGRRRRHRAAQGRRRRDHGVQPHAAARQPPRRARRRPGRRPRPPRRRAGRGRRRAGVHGVGPERRHHATTSSPAAGAERRVLVVDIAVPRSVDRSVGDARRCHAARPRRPARLGRPRHRPALGRGRPRPRARHRGGRAVRPRGRPPARRRRSSPSSTSRPRPSAPARSPATPAASPSSTTPSARPSRRSPRRSSRSCCTARRCASATTPARRRASATRRP